MAKGISRITVDSCGGVLVSTPQSSFYADGYLVAVIGTTVASHDPCITVPAHCGATMSSGSSDTFAEGIAVCREGDSCSCGHTVSGSSKTFVN